MPHRHQTVPLVCRRWRQLCTSPALLRTLCVNSVWVNGPTGMPATLAFFKWLERHAGGLVEHLDFSLNAAMIEEDWDICEQEFGEARAWAAVDLPRSLASFLAALCSCPDSRLRDLQLDFNGDVGCHPSSWLLRAPASLTRLSFRQEIQPVVVIPGLLSGMTALVDLKLSSGTNGLLTTPDCRLPTSLTKLSLESSLPSQLQLCQLTNLGRLHSLSLDGSFDAHSGANATALLDLTSLRRLRLGWWAAPPPCLPALTWLQSLAIFQSQIPFAEEEATRSFLASLTQ